MENGPWFLPFSEPKKRLISNTQTLMTIPHVITTPRMAQPPKLPVSGKGEIASVWDHGM